MPEESTHFLRYGTHSEKDYFLEKAEVSGYDVALINANMLAYTPKAMSAFALRLKKHFYVDPQTHAFQHDFEHVRGKNGGAKQSIKNLATAYGEPVSTALTEERATALTDFASEEIRLAFATNVVNFQLDKIHEVVTTSAEADYVNFALNEPDSGLSKDNIAPAGVLAPYFYIEGSNRDALTLNQNFIADAKNALGDKTIPLVAQLVLSQSALSSEAFRTDVVAAYAASQADVVFVWIDEFDEAEVSEELLRDFKSLVAGLRQGGKAVVNVYGGYFSILLTKVENGLNAVCHGMEYGESRKVVPVGGGLPRAKYYFPPLHKRLRSEDFRRITLAFDGWADNGSRNADFASNVCGCENCGDLDQYAETQTFEIKSKKGTTRRGETSTSAAKGHSLEHYLINKRKEYAYVADHTVAELAADMRAAADRYRASAQAGNVDHLERWARILEG